MNEESQGPTVERIEDQIAWYDKRSRSNQRWFKILKFVVLGAAASVPVLQVVVLDPKVPTTILAGIVLVAEGIQQLNQYQTNWIIYRSTCEELKHEKYLFVAKAGPYGNADNPLVLLAERIEGLISQEHAKWVSGQQEAGRGRKGFS